MSDSLHDFVLETLTSGQVARLNFRFGGALVYPAGYREDIARAVRNGRIRLTNNPSDVFQPGADQSANGVYLIDTPPGQPHFLYITPNWTIVQSGVLYLKELSAHEKADLRGTIIHEATHALHDYQRAQLDPPTAEGAAELAGWITRRLWNYQTSEPVLPTSQTEREAALERMSAHAYASYVARQFLDEPNAALRYLIPADRVSRLRRKVRTGSAHHYTFNGL